ncbi:unnamed protein product [Heterobilharzia americana]|nr:unnamed protein product [Heterobilharzia americana]
MLSYNVLGVAKEFTKGLDLVTDRKVFQQTTNLAAIQSSSYTLTTNPLKEVDSTVHDEISKNYYTVRTNLRNQPLIEISLIAGSPPPEPSSHKDTNLPSYQAPEEVVREILISPSSFKYEAYYRYIIICGTIVKRRKKLKRLSLIRIHESNEEENGDNYTKRSSKKMIKNTNLSDGENKPPHNRRVIVTCFHQPGQYDLFKVGNNHNPSLVNRGKMSKTAGGTTS